MNFKWLSLINIGRLFNQLTKMVMPKRRRTNWTVVSLLGLGATILTAILSRNVNMNQLFQKFMNFKKTTLFTSRPNINLATEFSNELLPALVEEKPKENQ